MAPAAMPTTTIGILFTMNATQAPSQNKRPPEKGSFPLDHYGECRPAMKDFLACMHKYDNSHIDCKKLSANYLQCRMDKCV
ncbi:hypothetical protein PsorP6_009567 [Peronosclerospora sorghi]|uniref:Uncharacterized protein n=1 Tax=Peronosclerospora sorghi TaxID=230839 RepID=A0ACC0VY35_9STRA|nr:hypothetical protein PsorP6_009567 [Peronosclerospora sorghi]